MCPFVQVRMCECRAPLGSWFPRIGNSWTLLGRDGCCPWCWTPARDAAGWVWGQELPSCLRVWNSSEGGVHGRFCKTGVSNTQNRCCIFKNMFVFAKAEIKTCCQPFASFYTKVFFFTYIYLRMYACMYVCMYLFIYIYICIHIHTHIYTQLNFNIKILTYFDTMLERILQRIISLFLILSH